MALVVVPLLCGSGCPSDAPADGNGNGNGNNNGTVAATVRMQNNAFVPSSVTIKTGQAVRWINDDVVLHTATSGSPGDPDMGSVFDSGNMGPGGTFTHTFNQAGIFTYHCEQHPVEMRDATVTVNP
ncbi:MAG: hypothetical protein HY718_05870 [Planctomycetes bacterium]|nr:hypothetical protein [Planctomycetota bacterium]